MVIARQLSGGSKLRSPGSDPLVYRAWMVSYAVALGVDGKGRGGVALSEKHAGDGRGLGGGVGDGRGLVRRWSCADAGGLLPVQGVEIVWVCDGLGWG